MNVLKSFGEVKSIRIILLSICLFCVDVSRADDGANLFLNSEITEDQSLPDWKYDHTPLNYRIGIFAGDQAGGPVRYNTHFPQVKHDPHPASYYHGAAFGGIEIERAFLRGGFIFGLLTRRDFAHKGINGRSLEYQGEDFVVEDFSYQGNSAFLSWALGSRYREAIWTVDLGFVYDRSSVDLKLTRVINGVPSIAQMNIESLLFRSRIHAGPEIYGAVNLTFGPEFHMPIWQRVSNRSDSDVRSFIDKNLELKASAAVGLSLMSSYRF